MGSPTESYKRLYGAVKTNDTYAIKQLLTKRTVDMETMAAKRAGKSLDDMLAAGGTDTTYAETMPTIRDERIRDNMAAIEVWDGKANTWDDLPYIFEDGAWKLALGDELAGAYRSPGPGRAVREAQAANSAGASSPTPSSSLPGRSPLRRIPSGTMLQ